MEIAFSVGSCTPKAGVNRQFASWSSGHIRFRGQDLTKLREKRLKREVRK